MQTCIAFLIVHLTGCVIQYNSYYMYDSRFYSHWWSKMVSEVISDLPIVKFPGGCPSHPPPPPLHPPPPPPPPLPPDPAYLNVTFNRTNLVILVIRVIITKIMYECHYTKLSVRKKKKTLKLTHAKRGVFKIAKLSMCN